MAQSNENGSAAEAATVEAPAAAIRPTPEESAPTVAAHLGSPAGPVDLDAPRFDTADLPQRYAQRARIGEGGMGEVLLLRDGWVGRDIAMKVVRGGLGSRSDARSRFLREARIQGQLEHPSVVPVYDLGRNTKGEVYFTMKRVKGMTLAQIIDGLRCGAAEVRSSYSTRQLLGALSHVCLCAAFAHARGVVHRDLKPANIMLGDFGEVYVLDWGIAKVAGASDVARTAPEAHDDAASANVATEAGALMGTPGYMAPEQVRGEGVDARTDIYALGAILFELLTLEPLHRGAAMALLASSLSGVDARPSQRTARVVVPPELDAICVKATSPDPSDRFASARYMHDAIERYLDGERDDDKRRENARAAVAAAQSALARASESGLEAEAARRTALRELGRALAFDPGHEGALEILSKVLLDAPTALPPEAEAELAEVNRRDRARASKLGAISYVTTGLALPLLLAMGVRDARWFAAMCLLTLLTAVQAWWVGATGKSSPRYMRNVIALGFVCTGVFSALFGPLLLVPSVATLQVASFTVNLRANRMTRAFVLAGAVLSVVVPLSLQALGVVAPSYAFEGGRLLVLPIAVGFPPAATFAVLALASLLCIAVTGVLTGNAIDALTGAERRLLSQAWRLRQLLPDPALTAETARVEPSSRSE